MRSFFSTSLSSAWESGGRTPVSHNVEASVFGLLASSSSRFTLDKVRLFPPAGGLGEPQKLSGSYGLTLWRTWLATSSSLHPFPSLQMIQSLLHSVVRLLNYFIRHRWLRRRSSVYLSASRQIRCSYDSLPNSVPRTFLALQVTFDGMQTESLISLETDEYLVDFMKFWRHFL